MKKLKIFLLIVLVMLLGTTTLGYATPADDNLKPVGASASGTILLVKNGNVYTFQYSSGGTTVSYTISLDNYNIQKGMISVGAQFNSYSQSYPINWGGLSYRDNSGNILNPWQQPSYLNTTYTVNYDSTAKTLTINYTDVYQSVTTYKSYKYSMAGKTLIIEVSSNGTAYNNNYTGLVLDRSYSTTNAQVIKIPYAENYPIVNVNNQYFYSTIVDLTKSDAGDSIYSASSYDANSVYAGTSTDYVKMTNGAINPIRETVYLTLSDSAIDTLYKTSKSKSSHRDALTDKVVFDMWSMRSSADQPNNPVSRNNLSETGSASREQYTQNLYDNWGMDKILLIDHQWQKLGYDIGFPVHYPAQASFGTNAEFTDYIAHCKNAGWLVALHEDYWFNDSGASGNTYWNDTEKAYLAKDSNGNWKLAWTNILGNTYSIIPGRMEYYSDIESAAIHSNYDTNACYLDVNPAYTPHDLEQLTQNSSASDSKTISNCIIKMKEMFNSIADIYDGPLLGEGTYQQIRFDSAYAGYVDGVEREICYTGSDPLYCDIMPDYELKVVRPLMANQGMGYLARAFGYLTSIEDMDLDKYRSRSIVFGHTGFTTNSTYDDRTSLENQHYFAKEYYMMQQLQKLYLDTSVTVTSIEYYDGTYYLSLDQALNGDYNFKESRIKIVYSNGLVIYANFKPSYTWNVSLDGMSYNLDTNGWVAKKGTDLLTYSCLKNGNRVDYVDCAAYTFADGRGVSTDFETFTSKGMYLKKKGTGDSTAPIISDVRAVDMGSTSCQVKATANENAYLTVQYGTTLSLGNKSEPILSFEKQDTVSLTGLSENTKYYYKVVAVDISGNVSESAINAFYTLSGPYNASTQFSSTQGSNNWYYQYLDGSTYSNMVWYASEGYWRAATDTDCAVYANGMHPGVSIDAVRKWVAPAAGYVKIDYQIELTSNSGDGVYCYSKLNNHIIYENEIGKYDGQKFEDDQVVKVNAGDALYFSINPSGTKNFDYVNWSPVITYLSKTSFNATNEFSGNGGNYSWYYKSYNNTGYSDMVFDEANNKWAKNGAEIYSNWMKPSLTEDACKVWVAPEAGQICISGNVRKKVTGGDGVKAFIIADSRIIWNNTVASDDTEGYNYSVYAHVEKDDVIVFKLNRNSTTTSDDTYWEPVISYGNPQDSVSGYSSAQGSNNWYYQKWNGSSYTDLDYNVNTSIWEYTGTNLFVASDRMHTEVSYDAVRKWVAPQDGRIEIHGYFNLAASGGDGTIASIYLNNMRCLQQTVSSTNQTWYSVKVAVKAGDIIYLRLNKNGTISFDGTYWVANIDYINNTFYGDDIRDVQGLDGWYYMKYDGSTYSELTTWDGTNKIWTYPTYLQVGERSFHPESAYDAVKMWEAPYSGTVYLYTSAVTQASEGDGVNIIVKKGTSETLWDRYISNFKSVYESTGLYTGLMKVQKINVTAGDKIYFRVNKNSDLYYDSTYLYIKVVYDR